MTRENFGLMATLPADELAHLQRRVRFLEAATVQLLRRDRQVKEWFTAAELAAMHLPKMPTTKAGVIRMASANAWKFRTSTGIGGERREYHFTVLPRRAFEALLDRVLEAPRVELGAAPGSEEKPAIPAAPQAPQQPAPAADQGHVPPWVLPLMRIVRARADKSLSAAIGELARRLPSDVPCPTEQEAAVVLKRLGYIGG